MLFIAHQLPRGLQIDEVFSLSAPPKYMTVAEEPGDKAIWEGHLN